MARFDSSIATAARLIKKNGETSILERRVPGTPPDPAKPYEPGTATITQTSVFAVWLEYAQARTDGEIVKQGDQQVLIAGSSLTSKPDPSTDFLVRASGDRWAVVGVETVQPNTQTILYTVQVRQ